MDAFLARLAQTIRRQRLLPRNATILLAVSGGLDSMSLLNALAALRAEFNWQVEVAHFNHRLRGRTADGDQRFVQRRCSAMNLPCHVGHWDQETRVTAIKQHGIEQAARNARRTFLGQVAGRVHARHVVMAHHADDQIELFFVRLLRGAGSRGLGGMKPRVKHGPPLNAWTVRPLLEFFRAEIAAWARTRKIKFRNDETNLDLRFMRNRVRHELLPFLERTFPAMRREIVLRTMHTLADEGDWLRGEAAHYLATPPNTRSPFKNCHPALQRQVIVVQLEHRGVIFNWETVEKLRVAADTRINAPGNLLLSRDQKGQIRIHRPTSKRFATDQSIIEVVGKNGFGKIGPLEVKWSRLPTRDRPSFGSGRELFDADAIGETAILRHWAPGDRFQPVAMSHPAKLQDLFTNARIPRDERRRKVIATTADGTIFWVEGLRIGERFKLTSATRSCLVWRWHRRRPNGR